MTKELMIAATAFFALGALDYGYRLIRTAYWDVKDMIQQRKWRKEVEAVQSPVVDVPTTNVVVA